MENIQENVLRISTKDPEKLIGRIVEKIELKKIRSWEFEEENEMFRHKGVQYVDHISLSYTIDDIKGTITFNQHSDGDEFAESKVPNLLKQMFISHFKDDVEIFK